MNNFEISDKVETVKNLIEKEENIKLLRNWHENIIKYDYILEHEREYLLEVIEIKIRKDFPKHAKKILGGKSEEAQKLLGEFHQTLTNEFDWSKNKVLTKVKVGGSMISGKEYICWYISYKNEFKYKCELAYHQKTIEEDPYLIVEYLEIGNNNNNENEMQTFPVQLKDEALNLFRTFLNKTIK
jgi:hypothetical protein